MSNEHDSSLSSPGNITRSSPCENNDSNSEFKYQCHNSDNSETKFKLEVSNDYAMKVDDSSGENHLLIDDQLQESKQVYMLQDASENSNSVLRSNNSALANSNNILANSNSALTISNSVLTSSNSVLPNSNSVLTNSNSVLTRNVTNDKYFYCNLCGKSYEDKLQFQDHYEHHFNKCTLCLAVFTNKESLNAHRKEVHGSSLDNLQVCIVFL